ncbi:MAG: high-affinity branched-chain amino acid ABC transporter permease LivM [Alphaproteobacteria bacterium]|nr:high-affinity branched-chain amino acid ABC transporter permease LivM [Alphaproteobacteria bacterium]
MGGAQRFKDAALTALVALALAFPLLGFRTTDVGDGFITRFSWVAIATAATFGGRLLLGLVPQRFRLRQYAARYTALPQGKAVTLAAAALILFAILLPISPFGSRRTIDLATLALIYVILGWGLNVVVGLAGLLDLGYVAFYAVGAYSFALAAEWYGLSFWEMLPIAGMISAMAGILLGLPVLRLRGDYLAIVTLGFGEIVRIVINNWSAVTNGPNGIGDIPRPTVFGMPIAAGAPEGVTTFNHFFDIAYDPLQRLIWLYYVCLAAALVINWFSLRIRRLPVGRAWEALREDEIACRALGLNPHTIKLTAFATGAMIGGFAGAIFAAKQGFISPESFNFQESATVVSIVVLGGMGSQLGIALAAVILATLPEFGRELAQYRMLFFGAAMVAIMIWRPRGLFTVRAPSVRLDQP